MASLKCLRIFCISSLLVATFSTPSIGQAPGSSFKDCPDCPEMVVIPAGEFMMGSTAFESEKPPHTVTIKAPLAVGKFEVTFDEWDACVAAGACKHNPSDQGWGRGKRPVINVSWEDTREYTSWLSGKTGKSYRLLTEAGWEYAARAGTTTPFSTGETITPEQANFDGNFTYGGSAKGQFRGRTIEAGTFNPNPFGLHDMHGNAGEYVQDCYNNNHNGAPTDGSAVAEAAGCPRVVRGGSWNRDPQNVRSSSRYRSFSGFRNDTVGFRVMRSL